MRKGLLATKLLFVILLLAVVFGGCSSDPNSFWYDPPPTPASIEYMNTLRANYERQDMQRQMQQMNLEIERLKTQDFFRRMNQGRYGY